MQLTKEFFESEISSLAREIDKANAFLIRAEAAMAIHKMLLEKLNEPVQSTEEPS